MGQQELANSDRLLLGLLTVFAGPTPDLSALGLSSGLVPYGFGARAKAQTAGLTLTPVQVAAQAALAATGVPQLGRALASFVFSFQQQDPVLALAIATAAKYAIAGAAVLIVGGAITPPGALFAADLAFDAGVAELGSVVFLASEKAVMTVGLAALSACADGLTKWGSVSSFIQGVVNKVTIGGEVVEAFDAMTKFVTWRREGHPCSTSAPSRCHPVPSPAGIRLQGQ